MRNSFIYKYLKPEKKKIIFAFSLILISSLFSITYGYLIGRAIEEASNINFQTSAFYFIIYFLIDVIGNVLIMTYGYYCLNKIKIRIINNINRDTYEKVLNLPSYVFEEKSSGEIINRATNDAEEITNTFKSIIQMGIRLLEVIIIYIYILLNSIIVALEIMVIILVMWLIIKHFNPIIKKTHERTKKINDKYTQSVSETVRGIREIKTLGIKKNIFTDISNTIEKLFIVKKGEIKVQTKYDISTYLTGVITEVSVFITCAFLLYCKDISLTFFVAMTYYVYRYTWIVEGLSECSKNIQQAKVAIKRINELLNNELYEKEHFGNIELDNSLKTIEFKNVTFAYKNNKPTLKNFSIKLGPNKKIAIVGASGQGKTTIFNLITRIFDTEKGKILINGVNIQDITEKSLRDNISIIRQEPFIFNKTIKENFKIINKRITDEEIEECCKKAYLDKYINSLDKKYNTLIGEGGVNLSGGQKQRLAIARTLAKKSSIILFDEATSALDNESQLYIKKSIDSLVKDHTIIIIAHRLSTIIDADIIYVVDNGEVIDSGTHNELLKKSEYYKKLYSKEC